MNESNYTELNQADKNTAEIYFCSHYDDRKLYFDRINEALSKELECSLRYDGDPLLDNDKKKSQHKLERMCLFVVPITKRFLSTESRAMTAEIPFARRSGIPVLPILVEAVDEALLNVRLAEIFGNVQYLVLDQGDPREIWFGDGLKNYLSSVLVSTENDSRLSLDKEEIEKLPEAEQKYLTGMAYYSGRGPKVDRNKAIELLEDAADSGHTEAMEQLSSFYRYGIGISSDSRERQMGYVLHCKERYEREGTEKSALRFADALDALGNLEDSLREISSADQNALNSRSVPHASLLMISLLEKTNEKYKTITVKRKLIAAYDGISCRYPVTKENGTAEAYGLLSIAILEEMAKYSYDTEIYENIAERYRALERGVEAEIALEYLQNAVMFYNKAKGKDRSPETLKGYIDIFESLSFRLINRAKDRYDESRLVSEKILALREELFEKEPYPENGIELCKKYLYFADLVSDARVVFQIFTPEDRLGFCSRVDELMDSLFADAEAVGHIQYSLTLKRLLCTAKAYGELEDNERAAEYYLKYILQLENAPANEISENHTRNKAEAYLALSKIFERMGFGGRATKCVLKAISFGTLKVYDYSDFMSEYVKKADSDTLTAFAADGFDHYSDLVDENTRGSFADLCISAYEICLKSGSSDAALKYLRSGIDAQRTVAETTGSRKDKIFLFRILAMLGDLYLRSESKTEAVTAYLECVIVGNSIGDGELLAEDHRILASVCHTVASFAEEEEDLERAEKYYILALKSRYRLYLMSNQREELSEGKAPLIAIYKKQGNGLYVIKKKHDILKQLKMWDNE